MLNRRTLMTAAAAAATTAATGAAAPAWAHRRNAPLGAWTPLADMPFPTQEIYPAAFWNTADPAAGAGGVKPDFAAGNVIVNAGGLTPAGDHFVTDAVTVYDPATDAWRYASPLPAPRHHVALVSNNGFLYAVGGFARNENGGWQMRGTCWRIADLDGRWEAMTPAPHPRGEAVCASLNGYVHVAGGRAPSGSRNREWSDHIDTDEHWAYDARADRWFTLAPMPTARNSAAGAVVGGALYVIGGRTVSDGNTAAVEVYDPQSDRWNRARPMPKAQGGLAAAVLNGKIYAFGGEYFDPRPGGVFSEAWEYDPRTDLWRAVAAMARPRHGLGAVALGEAIYVLGGAANVGGEDTSAALDKFEI